MVCARVCPWEWRWGVREELLWERSCCLIAWYQSSSQSVTFHMKHRKQQQRVYMRAPQTVWAKWQNKRSQTLEYHTSWLPPTVYFCVRSCVMGKIKIISYSCIKNCLTGDLTDQKSWNIKNKITDTFDAWQSWESSHNDKINATYSKRKSRDWKIMFSAPSSTYLDEPTSNII